MLDNRKFTSKKNSESIKKKRTDLPSKNFLSFDKLIYHPEKLAGFKIDKNVFPLTATISLGNYCNHGCLWCSTAYWRQDDSNSIDFIKLTKWLKKAVKRGLKGVGYVGNGEPLAYKDFSKLVRYVGNLNLDQGIFTNGFLIDRFQNELLDNFTYVRVSLDAGSKKIHSELHDAPSHHFKKIIENIKLLTQKRKNNAPTIGVQYATHQRNINDLQICAEICKDIGVDYLSVKPVFDRGSVHEKIEKNTITKSEINQKVLNLKKYETDNFKILYREHQFESESVGYNVLSYDRCYAGYFGVNIYENGDITGCGPHHINVGNLNTKFSDLEKNIIKLSESLDLKNCPAGCRYHPMNMLLHKLKNPSSSRKTEHINLI